MMDPFFLADSVSVTLGHVTVLKAAAFWARSGAVTVLLGRNGSGKTTLLRAALGLCPIEYGSVRVASSFFLRPRLSDLARHGVYFLPERGSLSRAFSLRWHMRAIEARFRPHPGMGMVWEELGLDGLLDHMPTELSGGQERRAEIAVALSRRPLCLLADEPFRGLAPRDQDVVSAHIRELADSGSAVLLTGHEVHALLELADEVLWLTGGCTQGLGSAEKAKAHFQFSREYLGA